ncbi:MAG: RNA methyltransferase [Bacteroidetes bacterium]|nr:MAG: RNA methyltransferase [Bacteroidota bacterium]
MQKYHAKTLRGLEELLADELRELGARDVRVRNRGVDFSGGAALMYRVNLASRLALRVLVPILKFEARDEAGLYRKIKQFDWSMYLDNRMSFVIDAVVFSQSFRNSHFVAQKAKDAIVDRFRERTGLRPSVHREKPDLRINLHISQHLVTISLDSSGSSLHKRGYRTGSFEAPLNEVLAAGMIMASGWKAERPFIDAMCGSGTLAIEAAMIAAGVAPGLSRKGFGFETWKDFDPELLEHVAQQLPSEKAVEVPIVARDVNPAAVRLTRRQLKNLELDHLVKTEVMDFADSPETPGGQTIFLNPPYGERLQPENLNGLYRMIGSTLKHRFPGSDAWILSSSKQALKHIGLRPSSKRVLYNGALECSFVRIRTFKGTLKEHKSEGSHKS